MTTVPDWCDDAEAAIHDPDWIAAHLARLTRAIGPEEMTPPIVVPSPSVMPVAAFPPARARTLTRWFGRS